MCGWEAGGFRSMWAGVGAPGMSAPYPFHFLRFARAAEFTHTCGESRGGRRDDRDRHRRPAFLRSSSYAPIRIGGNFCCLFARGRSSFFPLY